METSFIEIPKVYARIAAVALIALSVAAIHDVTAMSDDIKHNFSQNP